jgi:hypothetical protein
MSRYNRKPHKFTELLQPVKVLVNDDFVFGIIISKVHKMPKTSNIEEPFYLVTGIGAPVWEGSITPVSEEDYTIATALQGGC